MLVGAGAMLCLLWLGTAPAQAVNCTFDLESSNDGSDPGAITGGAGSLWEAENGGSIEDVALPDKKQHISRFDAFDTFGSSNLGAHTYANPDTDGCKIGGGGQRLTYPTDITQAIHMTPVVYISKKKPLGLNLIFLENTLGADQVVDFEFDGDLGSDSNTEVDRTSSGNGTADENDAWSTSCEDPDDDGCSDVKGEKFRDPEVAVNWQRKGNTKEKADVVEFVDGSSSIDVTYNDITIKAGKTVALAEIGSVYANIDAARKAAKKIGADPEGYGALAGLSSKEKNQLLNW